MLIAARFVQGIGGAFSSSVIVAIIVTEFPSPLERAKAMSAYVFVAVGGGSVGLLAGGVLTQVLDWHWIFFVNVPIGIATLVARLLPPGGQRRLGIKGVDWLGSIAGHVSVMLLIYAIVTAATDGWVSAHTLGLGGLGVTLFAGFLVLESRLGNPIMPLRILKLRAFTGSGIIRGCSSSGMFSTFFIGALYFEHVLDYSPVKTGWPACPQAVAMAAISAGITAQLVNRSRQAGDVPGHGPWPLSGFCCSRSRASTPSTSRRSSSPCCCWALGAGALVHAAVADRHVRNPQRGRRPGLGCGQRLAAAGRRRRPGRAEHHRRQPLQVPAGRRPPAPSTRSPTATSWRC